MTYFKPSFHILSTCPHICVHLIHLRKSNTTRQLRLFCRKQKYLLKATDDFSMTEENIYQLSNVLSHFPQVNSSHNTSHTRKWQSKMRQFTVSVFRVFILFSHKKITVIILLLRHPSSRLPPNSLNWLSLSFSWCLTILHYIRSEWNKLEANLDLKT